MWSRFAEALVPFSPLPPALALPPTPIIHAFWEGGGGQVGVTEPGGGAAGGKHRTRSEQFTSQCGMCAYRLHCQCQIFGGLAIFIIVSTYIRNQAVHTLFAPVTLTVTTKKKEVHVFFPFEPIVSTACQARSSLEDSERSYMGGGGIVVNFISSKSKTVIGQ